MHRDFPILLRIWFVILGSAFVVLAWWPRGQWYFKRTRIPVPNWLHKLFTLTAGVTFIVMGFFGHISN